MLDKGTSFPGRERWRHRHAHLFGSPTDAIPRAPQQQPRPSHHGGRERSGASGRHGVGTAASTCPYSPSHAPLASERCAERGGPRLSRPVSGRAKGTATPQARKGRAHAVCYAWEPIGGTYAASAPVRPTASTSLPDRAVPWSVRL